METQSIYNLEKWPKDLLIDYCIKVHHRNIRANGPKIIERNEELINQYPKDKMLQEIHLQMKESLIALEEHLQKEEKVLFPFLYSLYDAYQNNSKIESIHCGSIINPINVMIFEHIQEDNRFEGLKTLTNNFDTTNIDTNYISLYIKLKSFIKGFYEHIYIENELIFPFFEKIEQSHIMCNNIK